MVGKFRFLKFFTFPCHGEKGFTLIEILVVIAILGSLSGVVITNIGKFIGSGEEEAKEVELRHVQTAAQFYLADKNKISKPFTVSPENQGVLDSYLIGNLTYRWVVNVDSSVSPYKASDEPKPTPEPVPTPKPKPVPTPKPLPKPLPVQPFSDDLTVTEAK